MPGKSIMMIMNLHSDEDKHQICKGKSYYTHDKTNNCHLLCIDDTGRMGEGIRWGRDRKAHGEGC